MHELAPMQEYQRKKNNTSTFITSNKDESSHSFVAEHFIGQVCFIIELFSVAPSLCASYQKLTTANSVTLTRLPVVHDAAKTIPLTYPLHNAAL